MSWEELEDEQHAPTITRLKCGRVRFNSDSAIFMPEGIPIVAAILKYLQKNPDLELLIASHTDTVDTASHNDDLSAARAANVLYFISGDTNKYATHCHERANKSKNRDVRQVLDWAADVWNFPCDPGEVKNEAAPAKAIIAFKEAFGRKFTKGYDAAAAKETATVDGGFWSKVVRLYGNTLRYDHLRIDLPGFKKMVGAIKWVDPDLRSIGCGEKYLLVQTKNDQDKEENRRTEFLFLKPDDKPKKEGTDGAYLEKVYQGGYAFQDLDCPPPDFFGKKLPEGNIVFVIDCSGSMAARTIDGNVVDRIGEARRNLSRAILDLDSSSAFTVVAYNGVPVGTTPAPAGADPNALDEPTNLWSSSGSRTQPLLKPATPENKAAAAAWVNLRPAAQQTMTARALKRAFEATGLLPDKPTTLILLSDGAPTPRSAQFTQVSERAEIVKETKASATAKKWKVETIGMLTKVDETGALVDFLKKLASDNGGTFTPVAAIPLVSGT